MAKYIVTIGFNNVSMKAGEALPCRPSGFKVPVIKIIRAVTRMDLAEAKSLVETYENSFVKLILSSEQLIALEFAILRTFQNLSKEDMPIEVFYAVAYDPPGIADVSNKAPHLGAVAALTPVQMPEQD